MLRIVEDGVSIEVGRFNEMNSVGEKQDQNRLQVVSFLLNEIHYAIDIAVVREIIYFKPTVPLPHAPSFIEGVLDLRGTVVPIIDLRKKLGVKSGEVDERNHILVLQLGKDAAGLIVDQVEEVTHIIPNEIQEPHKIHGGPQMKYLKGISKMGEQLLFLLETNMLLTTNEKVSLDEIKA